MRWINILFVLAVNAVPFYGAMFLGWSVSTILVLYWVENLALIATTSTRIVMHRIWTRRRGHWTGSPEGTGPEVGKHANTYLVQYAAMALVFTLAHGVFVIAIAIAMTHNHPQEAIWRFSFEQFRAGALTMCALLAVDLALDLTTLRGRNFAWLKNYVDRRTARVFILHVGLIFGMCGIFLSKSPLGLLAALMGLKTLVDIAGVWPAATAEKPGVPDDEPPAWANRTAKAIVGGGKEADELIAKWKADRLLQAQGLARSEEVMPV